MLIGNKCDMLTEKVVDTSRGQALADEYGIKFFETSAKSNVNVSKSFEAIAEDIMKKQMQGQGTSNGANANSNVNLKNGDGTKKEGCCK